MFDLTGFELDDAAGGSSSYVLTGTLAVGEIRVFFRSETNIALNDSGGDTVRLLAPDGTVLDEYEYVLLHTIKHGRATRVARGTRTGCPRRVSQTNHPTPTPTLTPSPTLTLTPTPSPSPIPDGLELNEFLPRPESDWNEDGEADTDDEYIETHQPQRAGVRPDWV